MRKALQIILYIPIQMVFIPFALVGLLDGLYREIVIGKRLGVSFSAIKALQYRWIGHYFNIRKDPLSVAFVKKLPCESHFGMLTIMGALIISRRIFGFTTSSTKVIEPEDTFDATAITRVRVFDRILERYISEVDQLVLPGVGFDLIALHHPKAKGLKVFELDQSETLNLKTKTLNKAGVEHDWINYIPVDYNTENWADKLLEAGFDKTKKTLFLWQSVSLFLEEELVRDSIQKMRELCSERSIIVQDFYSEAFINGDISKAALKQFNLFKKMGEPTKFALDMSSEPHAIIENFLGECGLQITNYIQFGKNINKEPFYCITEATRN